MIWSAGKILPDDALTIGILDRTFEHGLGLFETLRTWGGRPTLLDRHLDRMLRSASELDLPIDPASLPQESDVRSLLEVEGVEGDRLLRITATGGTSTNPSVVWMKSGPLPEPMGEAGASLLLDSWSVGSAGSLARHKTLNYWTRRRVYENARRLGFDEALSLSSPRQSSCFQEGSRTNLFVVRDRGIKIGTIGKRRPVLITSATAASIVPGVMREVVIEIAGELSIAVDERNSGIDPLSLRRAQEIFLTNSVRGIIPVARATYRSVGHQLVKKAPGPVTARLQEALARRLWL